MGLIENMGPEHRPQIVGCSKYGGPQEPSKAHIFGARTLNPKQRLNRLPGAKRLLCRSIFRGFLKGQPRKSQKDPATGRRALDHSDQKRADMAYATARASRQQGRSRLQPATLNHKRP